ncbi:Adenine phosphoribosyl transferase [Fasciola hepatica]|uniref:Adenine phosphoribosyltransferase n=1 Tax=Fasciola hepatica TaxID=6192 RepID=A0A4E0S349_FASHE|nr:Adenine phosphoribosyl transferase [Fasciola hepatica]
MSKTVPSINARLQGISDAIGTFPDFPKKGINFRDIFGALRNPSITRDLLDELKLMIRQNVLSVHPKIDAVIGIDARGFLFGLTLSCELNCGFVPVRKSGKLPGPCYSVSYALEYGEAEVEMQKDALKPGDKVILVDDLLATGGSLNAASELVRKSGAIPVAAVVVMELDKLNGREKLESSSVAVHSLLLC